MSDADVLRGDRQHDASTQAGKQKGQLVMSSKTEVATVQEAISEAVERGMTVFQRGKHIVATNEDGVPFYLGGGVEAPRWDEMRRIAVVQ